MRRSLLPVVLVTACGGEMPSNPTYFADVQPILRANCGRCHGADPAELKLATDQAKALIGDTLAAMGANRADNMLRVLQSKAAAVEAARCCRWASPST